jgi:CRISPR-associated protein Csc1
MTKIYRCKLTLHDNVFFASREMGILYETEKYFHNWALSYAFFKGTIIPHPYGLVGQNAQTPAYLDRDREQNLLQLNDSGIYVFPAQPVHWSYQINTFKAAQSAYYGRSVQFGGKGATKNYPINYGRAKELAVGSEFLTYIVSQEDLDLPVWIRLGKWSSKIRVEVEAIAPDEIKTESGVYVCNHPLNPLDCPVNQQILLYNRIVMPPSSLFSQSQLQGDYWKIGRNTRLPQGFHYGAATAITQDSPQLSLLDTN